MAKYMTMALDSDTEASLFTVLGFTLDDIESAEVPYHVNSTPRLKKLDLEKVKALLAPLDKTQRRFSGKIPDGPYKLLLFLKYGDQGENVGELRKLHGSGSCGQLTLSLRIAKDGSCIYLTPNGTDGYDYRYYSPAVAKLNAFINESMLCV